MNRLVDPVKKFTEQAATPETAATSIAHSVNATEGARYYAGTLDATQKRRVKKMLESGAVVGESVAQAYGISPEEFAEALKEVV